MTPEDPTSTHDAVSAKVDIESDEAAEDLLDEPTEPIFIPPLVPRALGIPEVPLEIFVASTGSTRAAAARVCRSWSPLALDVPWRDMESPIPLLQVLSPLQPKQTPEQDGETYKDWDFANGLFDVDWTRFHSYATRIRTLVYRLNDPTIGGKNNCLSPRALERVALLYPHGRYLVPNIQELGCHVTWDERTTIPGALVSRTAMLNHFPLSTNCPVVEFEGALVKWFGSTPLLTEAELPQYYQTEMIVGTLGRLENLRSLAKVWDNHLPYDAHGVHFQLSQDSFPGLTNLDIEGNLDYALATLQTSPRLSRIKCICLTSYRAPTSEEELNLATALASNCSVLDVVWLNLVSADDTTTTEPLAFEVFQPLLESHQVIEFVPELKVLLLTRDPNRSSDNLTSEYGLDISILAHMAQKLRNLTNLGLFLDVERFTDFEDNLDPPHQFTN
ncbi:hypothetical protein M407DRAFT_18903 [Tulasnella calospora MUT 4182]|uniref:F-box domain-containing protein n=1 Tax=Tulasnella calospora MUT 4182 TaxID=1051891 RepID=A0A0C3QIV7_9AGAM|nr:hypothetical protein M407DRAFT_18903 [Tulasnella calospora MUT 4182]